MTVVLARVGPGQATWVVDRAPILDVAGVAADGRVIFGYPAGATRLANGSLLIADRAENAIRLVDPMGRLVRSSGRMGAGPNEFQSMIWAGGCGADSLLVWDLRREQGSMIGTSGAIARQFAIAPGDTAQDPYRWSCSNRGATAYLSTPRPTRTPGPPTDSVFRQSEAGAYRVSRSGTIEQRLGSVPAGEMALMTSPNGGRGGAPRPLGRTATVAAVGSAIAIGSADSAVVTVVSANGSRSRIVLPIATRAPTREEFDAAVQATASQIPAQIRNAMITQLSALPMPVRIPPISALFGDPAELLWVQTSPPGARQIDFLVTQLDGRVVARTTVPFPVTIYEIGRDYVLGSYEDSSGEIHVAVWRLRRS